MSVDWFTVTAQIVNFLILVWLLKKFLYKPILTAMEKRQEKIRAELGQAADLAQAAEKEKTHYLALQEEIKERGKQEFRKAHQEAEQLRQKLFDEIHAEAEVARQRLHQELSREKTVFLNQVSSQVAVQFHQLAQNAFRQLADENLEQSMVARFCAFITDHDHKHHFFQQLQHTKELKVHSGFSLTSTSKEAITHILHQHLQAQPTLEFLCEPTLIAGILLSSDDHKLEWNIHHYLDDFQDELQKMLSRDNA